MMAMESKKKASMHVKKTGEEEHSKLEGHSGRMKLMGIEI
jgi:hypothetical protein